ncbi:MAG: hypothetical protein AAF243_00595 [Cyanobacteria bacterium P01_A01_bin.137]
MENSPTLNKHVQASDGSRLSVRYDRQGILSKKALPLVSWLPTICQRRAALNSKKEIDYKTPCRQQTALKMLPKERRCLAIKN